MKRWFKRWLKSDRVRGLAADLIALYVRLVDVTGRWTIEGEERAHPYWNEGRPFIGAFWHGRLLMMSLAWRTKKQKMAIMISRHRDGEIIARAIAHFGVGAVRGSTAKAGTTDKGGRDALREMLRTLKAGISVSITPDGPRGPARRVSPGIVQVARLTGLPIMIGTYSARWAVSLKSWDRFLLALPFTRGVVLWGGPFHVPRDLDDAGVEAMRRQIEDEMNRLTDQADARCGRARA